MFREFEFFLKSHDIIGVAETKACEEDVISFIGYTYFPKHRKNFVRRSSGLGVLVKDDFLPFVGLIEIDSEFLILIKTLISKDEDMLISFVYLLPEGSDYSTNDSLSEIE